MYRVKEDSSSTISGSMNNLGMTDEPILSPTPPPGFGNEQAGTPTSNTSIHHHHHNGINNNNSSSSSVASTTPTSTPISSNTATNNSSHNNKMDGSRSKTTRSDASLTAAASSRGNGWYTNQRTTSFSNLAAVVGTGLAESMEDSTTAGGAGDLSTAASSFLIKNDFSHYDAPSSSSLSYARQSRHAASRLIGINSTSNHHHHHLGTTALNAGSNGMNTSSNSNNGFLLGSHHHSSLLGDTMTTAPTSSSTAASSLLLSPLQQTPTISASSTSRHISALSSLPHRHQNNNNNTTREEGDKEEDDYQSLLSGHRAKPALAGLPFPSSSAATAATGPSYHRHHSISTTAATNDPILNFKASTQHRGNIEQRHTSAASAATLNDDQHPSNSFLFSTYDRLNSNESAALSLAEVSSNIGNSGTSLHQLYDFNHHRHHNDTLVGVTVMEPSEQLGRSSAPPQLVAEDQYQPHPSTIEELQSHMNQNLHISPSPSSPSPLKQHQSVALSPTPTTSASITTSTSTVTATTPDVEQDLAPFLWSVLSSSPSDNGSNSGVAPSRTLALLRISSPSLIPEIRSTCEAFGVLEAFRGEFCVEKGVVFCSYYDIRSATLAAHELQTCLLPQLPAMQVKFCVPLNSSTTQDDSILVLSDLPPELTNSMASQETLASILSSYGAVRSLQVQPGTTHYGGVSYIVEFHNVQDAKQALFELESTCPWGPDVLIEVGVRRAVDRKRGRELMGLLGRWRHAATSAGVATTASGSNSGTSASGGRSTKSNASSRSGSPSAPTPTGVTPYSTNSFLSGGNDVHVNSSNHAPLAQPLQQQQQQSTQLVIGPDGRYSYVVVNHSAYPEGHAPPPPPPRHHHHHHNPPHRHQHHHYPPPHHQHQQHVGGGLAVERPPPRTVAHVHHQHATAQHVVHSHHGTYVTSMSPTTGTSSNTSSSVHYWTTTPSQHHGGHHQPYHHHPHHHVPQQPSLHHHHHHPHNQHHSGTALATTAPYTIDGHQLYASSTTSGANAAVPYYAHVVTNQTDSSVSSGSGQSNNNGGSHVMGRGGVQSNNDSNKDNRHLVLSIEAVETGRDTRTSLMVRNIPNKYTQQMLLSEFTDNGHGPGKIDFFYLPIDFKNKCNRGYAFINFCDYRDIVSFHRQYFGQHWRIFNSDKICDITYARIQGKVGMLKRFENSALMEKDEEYKPLVFVSHGPDKGKQLPFPTNNNNKTTSTTSTPTINNTKASS